MSKQPNIQRLIEFHRFLLAFQGVERVAHVPGKFEQENDTEHSYNLALSAWYLAEYFPWLDHDKVIRLALVHDLVEVHAGDTYIYGEQSAIDTKQEREHAALLQIQKDWPDFPDMTVAIKEYEARGSEEAKFVYALDKIMPIMLIFLGNGYSWQKGQITLEKLHATKLPKVAVSSAIKPYYDQLYELLERHRHYFPEPEKN
ncbi:MAG TPA: HD domain-containing protein [Candidatus Saccharimonadales bacterium]|nr:HD domain-containing protein [Candidatus Saccharimonadales bacterium]